MIFTENTIGARIAERKLTHGDRLWVAGEKLATDVFRQGNSPGNPAVYLRWKDLEIDKPGKIEGDDLHTTVIRPGFGLSMFIEKMVQSDFNLIGSQDGQFGKGALAKLAAEKGYVNTMQIHWFKMTEGKVMPVGLEVVFDNEPPGHCTLTVTRAMTVHEFLGLIADNLGFDYIGSDIFGKN